MAVQYQGGAGQDLGNTDTAEDLQGGQGVNILRKTASLKVHPEASRVPPMRPNEYSDFLDDIKERGIRVAIEVQPGTSTILDGRCRLMGAKELGIEEVPVIEAPINGDDPVVYMLRQASKRRHFSDDQRAMIADEERQWLAEKGKQNRKREAKKQADRGKEGGRGHKKNKPLRDDASRKGSPARQKAAKTHRVSERKLKQAQKVKNHSPELAEKVKNGELTLAQAVRELEREERKKELEAKAADPKPTDDSWRIIQADWLDGLARHVSTGEARLAFMDPPYNIGIDYGDGSSADSLDDGQYLCMIDRCFHQLKPRLSADGSLWVLICDEYAGDFACMLKDAGFHIRAWIKWYETFGVNRSNNFNRCSRHLFYCVKDPKKCLFNADAVNRPSDRQTKYGDKRADPGGKIWDDVWQIPRLVGTAKERLPDFPTQLPLELLRPIVGCCSDPGDLVLDPFSGSGTTGVACLELGRRFIGIEKSKQFAELSIMRLKGIEK